MDRVWKAFGICSLGVGDWIQRMAPDKGLEGWIEA